MRYALATVLVLLASVFAAPAYAGGGHYSFAGGTKTQRATVTAALQASSFNWNLVPQTIQIRIAPAVPSEATVGVISLDANLLDAGTLSWGVVQHEYAHQVDFFLLGDAQRAQLFSSLGGSSWWQTGNLPHGELASERFASTLAWAYWQSPQNIMKPAGPNDEAGAVPPATFRQLVQSILGVSSTPLSALPSIPSKAPALPHGRTRR
jgi:hypothetical protein